MSSVGAFIVEFLSCPSFSSLYSPFLAWFSSFAASVCLLRSSRVTRYRISGHFPFLLSFSEPSCLPLFLVVPCSAGSFFVSSRLNLVLLHLSHHNNKQQLTVLNQVLPYFISEKVCNQSYSCLVYMSKQPLVNIWTIILFCMSVILSLITAFAQLLLVYYI